MVYNNSFLVIEVRPANNETGVAVNSSVSVKFAMDMNLASINPSTITLTKVNGGSITASVAYLSASRTAMLTPSAPLDNGTQYRITVLGGVEGVKTVTDATMPESKVYEFSTSNTMNVSPPQTVAAATSNRYVTINWAAPETSSPGAAITYEAYISSSSLDPVALPGAIVWPTAADSIGTITVTSVGTARQIPVGNYFVYVRAKSNGSTSDWTSNQFTVEDQAADIPGTPSDPMPPSISSFEVSATYPKLDAVHIKPGSIKVLFTSNIDAASITDQTVYVVEAKKPSQLTTMDLLTDFAPDKRIAITIDAITQPNLLSLTVDPTALKDNAEYTVIIRENIKDSQGGTLGEAFYWSFTTTYTPLFADPAKIRDDLREYIADISDKLLYQFVHDTSIMAFHVVQQQVNYAPQDYTDGKAPLFMQEYVRHQTAYDLMVHTAIQSTGTAGSTRTLGDLTITTKAGTTGAGSMLREIKDRIKPWLDELHGHTNRGYAKPTVVVRGENIEAYPDHLVRVEFKDLFGN